MKRRLYHERIKRYSSWKVDMRLHTLISVSVDPWHQTNFRYWRMTARGKSFLFGGAITGKCKSCRMSQPNHSKRGCVIKVSTVFIKTSAYCLTACGIHNQPHGPISIRLYPLSPPAANQRRIWPSREGRVIKITERLFVGSDCFMKLAGCCVD